MSQGYRKINAETKQEYLNWLLTPPTERSPRSKDAMAEQLGVTARTLYNWENSEEFQAELKSVKAKWGTRWYGDILGRLKGIIDEGTDRDAISAARVLLGHLHVEVEDKSHDPTEDQVAAIRELLEGQGYKVIHRSDS